LRRSLAGYDFSAVINLAAYGVAPSNRAEYEMRLINCELPQVLVSIANDRGAIAVMAGSCAEYAATSSTSKITETAPLEQSKLYGASKAAGGIAALAQAASVGVPMRYLRLFNIYGPGEPAHRLLPSLIAAAATGGTVPLSFGTQIRDWVYVGDAVRAIEMSLEALLTKRRDGARALNICTGSGSSVRQFAILAAEHLGMEISELDFGALPFRPDDLPWLVGDPHQSHIDLGWQPTYDLENGIAHAIATFRRSGIDHASLKEPRK